MLAILGFFMMLVFMVLIMTKRLSVLTALVLTPIVFASYYLNSKETQRFLEEQSAFYQNIMAGD
ncbi:hypothetical protein DT075_35855 [Bacillus licheniformis]|nr:hypothetical protein DT075_35855 [Bacillus licheniformis]